MNEAADQDPDAPAEANGGPGWHGRGYLPHFDRSTVTQHVTFHLADSLAKTVIECMEGELRRFPIKSREVERRKKIEAWIDAGHGSCILREPEIAAIIRDSLRFFDGQRYHLRAWVVMPNHVHVLVQPIRGWTIAKIVTSWKKFTARQIGEFRRKAGEVDPGKFDIPIGLKQRITERDGRDSERVWHPEYWDRYMRDEDHFRQVIEYIHQNPVKAGLVAKAEEWRWSSAYREKTRHNDLPRRGDK